MGLRNWMTGSLAFLLHTPQILMPSKVVMMIYRFYKNIWRPLELEALEPWVFGMESNYFFILAFDTSLPPTLTFFVSLLV